MGNMADELLCDHKVSNSDYMFSSNSIKIGDFYCTDDFMNLNLEFEDDVVNMLPSDPFEMNISSSSSGCTMINLDDTNGLFYFGETSKNVLHSNNECNASCCNGNGDGVSDGGGDDEGPPHDGLFFALGYLETEDLLTVECVCKSLRDGVCNDPLLWRNVHIDEPNSELFNDDSLLRITSRAKGRLQSLSLIQCNSITDNGLRNVFQQNPGLTKLSVLTCNGMTMEGLLSNLKYLKSTVGKGIERLRIGTLYYVTMEQYEDLKKILSIDNNQKTLSNPKPRFYHSGPLYLSLDDDRTIDIEACPRCHQFKQVFDCPAEKCSRRHNYCRGCKFCIPRCISCGCCFDERDYMETFSLDFLCLDCFTQILRFPVGDEEFFSITGFHQQANYHFCLYGLNDKQDVYGLL